MLENDYILDVQVFLMKVFFKILPRFISIVYFLEKLRTFKVIK